MILPYLHFKGNCEEAMNFYSGAFGGGKVHISRMNNDPTNHVMHASVMFNGDIGGVSGSDYKNESEISGMEILVLLPSRKEVDEILPRLAEGGTVVTSFQPHPPPDDDGGGATVLDKYGYTWFLCC